MADEKKYSDKDLDVIISKKFAKWQTAKTKEIDEAKKSNSNEGERCRQKIKIVIYDGV